MGSVFSATLSEDIEIIELIEIFIHSKKYQNSIQSQIFCLEITADF